MHTAKSYTKIGKCGSQGQTDLKVNHIEVIEREGLKEKNTNDAKTLCITPKGVKKSN